MSDHRHVHFVKRLNATAARRTYTRAVVMSHPQHVPEPTEGQRTNAPGSIGKRLRALTSVLHLTSDEVADLSGVPQRHVHDWLAGVRIPSCRQMSRLVRESRISLAWIYYGDEHDLPQQQLALLREALDRDADIQSNRSRPRESPIAHGDVATAPGKRR